MDYNFHTHTTRCRHASGTDEEYIKTAIEAEMLDPGFYCAPNIFLGLADGVVTPCRVSMKIVYHYLRMNLLKLFLPLLTSTPPAS